MDLSAVIFALVALAWGAYLLPKVLKRSDELSARRPVDEFSDEVRVLRRPSAVASTPTTAPESARPQLTRAAARKAAQRRRRVLYVLLAATALTAGLAGFAITPWWSVAMPAGLIVAFLVIARMTVRAENAKYAAPVAPSAAAGVDAVVVGADEVTEAHDFTDLRGREVKMDALADEGALWDPLPITLPTYVGKAHARRTVRTIDLTGISSSGHDEDDSKLAREADETRKADAAEAAAVDSQPETKVSGA